MLFEWGFVRYGAILKKALKLRNFLSKIPLNHNGVVHSDITVAVDVGRRALQGVEGNLFSKKFLNHKHVVNRDFPVAVYIARQIGKLRRPDGPALVEAVNRQGIGRVQRIAIYMSDYIVKIICIEPCRLVLVIAVVSVYLTKVNGLSRVGLAILYRRSCTV